MNEETMNRILTRIGALVENRAKRLCPVDYGDLRTSITFRIEGDTVFIYSPLDYAKDMEYGTPPDTLTDAGEANLKDWAERHGLPSGAVIKKIRREGIKVGTPKNPMETESGYRPFLRPALLQSYARIREIIREEMAKEQGGEEDGYL